MNRTVAMREKFEIFWKNELDQIPNDLLECLPNLKCQAWKNFCAGADIIERACGQDAVLCAAKHSDTGANDPQDCDWPFCGCDPKADKVIEAIQESGFTLVKDEDLLKMTKAAERAAGETAWVSVDAAREAVNGALKELMADSKRDEIVILRTLSLLIHKRLDSLPSPPTGRTNAEEEGR